MMPRLQKKNDCIVKKTTAAAAAARRRMEGIVIPENNHATHHNYAGVSDDSRRTVRKANTAGMLKSHEELVSVSRRYEDETR